MGIRVGRLVPGVFNAITDVEGVRVGHVTRVEDDVKAAEAQVKQTELMEVIGRLTRTRSEWLTQRRLLQETIDELNQKPAHERWVEQSLFLRHCQAQDARIKALEGRIRELEAEQKQKLAELTRIKQLKEGLERVREQAYADFIKEQEKLEQREMDEMTALRSARVTHPI